MAALMRSLRDLNRGGVICDWRAGVCGCARGVSWTFAVIALDRALEGRQLDQRRRHDRRRHVHRRRRRRLVEVFRRRRRRRQVHDREILDDLHSGAHETLLQGPEKNHVQDDDADEYGRRARTTCGIGIRHTGPVSPLVRTSRSHARKPGRGPCQISSRRAFKRAPIPATATLAVGRIDCKRRPPPV